MRRIVAVGLALGFISATVLGCATTQSTLNGQLNLPEGAQLPADGTIIVQIQDTSLADGPAQIVGEQRIQSTGQGMPIEFNVSYDRGKIVENHVYDLAVQVKDGKGSLIFINEQAVPVLTRGAPTSGIQVPLVPASAAAEGSLTSNPWLLTELAGKAPIAGTQISAEFGTGGILSGSAGCNAYSAPYQASDLQLSVGKIVTTLLACGGAAMQQESDYLMELAASTGYEIDAGKLTLTDASGKSLAIFKAQNEDLRGSSWLVTGYNDGKGGVTMLLPGTHLDATFGTDGNIGGSAGCNDYFAPYALNGTAIQIGETVSTKALCTKPAGIMEQESAYLLALRSAATFELSGSSLTLRARSGAISVSFTRAQ